MDNRALEAMQELILEILSDTELSRDEIKCTLSACITLMCTSLEVINTISFRESSDDDRNRP